MSKGNTFQPEQRWLDSLLEGKMIHQFMHDFSKNLVTGYEKKMDEKLFLGRSDDKGQLLDYQDYRLGFRKIARNTDERTMIRTVIPPTFVSENLQTVCVSTQKENKSFQIKKCCFLQLFLIVLFLMR